jgi:polysaccharide export outer membrane protein
MLLKNRSLSVLGLSLLILTSITLKIPNIARPSTTEKIAPTTANQIDKPSVEAPYTLGPGDTISINIFDAEEYSGEYVILNDGTVNLPLVGNVSLQGLTLTEATEAISARYGTILKRPLVNVRLTQIRPVKIAVSGEVSEPGFYALSLFDPESRRPELRYPTAIDAIERAGGITLAADVRQIQLRRTLPSGSEEVFNLNLWEFLQTGNFAPNITLRDGDTIFVPTVSKINLAEIRQLANTKLASDAERPANVTVVGEVNLQGSYVLVGVNTTGRPDGFATVISALQEAGGITILADIRKVRVRRVTRTGREQIIPVDLWEILQTGNMNLDPLLQDGDTIVVPTITTVNQAEVSPLARTTFSPATIRISVVGEVERSAAAGLQLEFPLNTTLNQAILAAGGFNPRSNRDFVELIRLNPNGSISRRTIPIDFSQGINQQSNPLLHNNDIIVINRSGLASFSDNIDLVLSRPGVILDRAFTILRILEIMKSLQQ